jgi:hypothetical protein
MWRLGEVARKRQTFICFLQQRQHEKNQCKTVWSFGVKRIEGVPFVAHNIAEIKFVRRQSKMNKQSKSASWSPDVSAIQKGNPNSLKKRPHNFPRKSISRFSGSDGRVHVNWKNGSASAKKGPKSDIFIFDRLWDQRTEDFSNTLFEMPFQSMADELLRRNATTLSTSETIVAAKMFALWRYRSWCSKNPPHDQHLSGCKVPSASPTGWTQDEGEQLEKRGFIITQQGTTQDKEGYVSPVVPRCMTVWPKLKNYVEMFAAEHVNRKWGMLVDPFTNIIIPDICPSIGLLPLSPNRCIEIDAEDQTLTELESQNLRKILVENSDQYWISKG